MVDVAGGQAEDGIVIGNTYDKYGSKNPLVKWMMAGFDGALGDLVRAAHPKSIHEVGCGEGYWSLKWLEAGFDVRGTDFSTQVIGMAKAHAKERELDEDAFVVRSIYDVSAAEDGADLVVCCEVFEHLEDPRQGFEALQRIVKKDLIMSVPREPIWRMLNMARGKYWSDLGNTPGHLNHWSQRGFVNLASEYFDVIDVRAPLPWTMIRARVKD